MVTFDQIKEIIVDCLGCDPADVTPEVNLFKDLGADSFDSIEIVVEIENAFNVIIPDADYEKLESATVNDIVRYVNERLNQS